MSITWANERRKLSDLLPWPRNPRQISRDQAKRLVQSFDEFGQVEPIALGPGNEVYNGHQRLAVLGAQYGPDHEIEVRVASRPLTEKEREKLTVFLHRGTTGEWDWDALANGFEQTELLEWGFGQYELGMGYQESDLMDSFTKGIADLAGDRASVTLVFTKDEAARLSSAIKKDGMRPWCDRIMELVDA